MAGAEICNRGFRGIERGAIQEFQTTRFGRQSLSFILENSTRRNCTLKIVRVGVVRCIQPSPTCSGPTWAFHTHLQSKIARLGITRPHRLVCMAHKAEWNQGGTSPFSHSRSHQRQLYNPTSTISLSLASDQFYLQLADPPSEVLRSPRTSNRISEQQCV